MNRKDKIQFLQAVSSGKATLNALSQPLSKLSTDDQQWLTAFADGKCVPSGVWSGKASEPELQRVLQILNRYNSDAIPVHLLYKVKYGYYPAQPAAVC